MSTVNLVRSECAFNCHLLTDPLSIILGGKQFHYLLLQRRPTLDPCQWSIAGPLLHIGAAEADAVVMVMSFDHWHRGWDGQSGTRSTTRASPGAQGVLGEPRCGARHPALLRQWARRPSHDSGSAGSMPVVTSNDHRAAISVPAAARPPGPASSGVPVTMPPLRCRPMQPMCPHDATLMGKPIY